MAQMTQPVMMFNLLKFIEVSGCLKFRCNRTGWVKSSFFPAVYNGGEGNVFKAMNARVWNS
jgi:hypothetical protein